MKNVAKFETFRNFTILNEVLLFFIEILFCSSKLHHQLAFCV